MDLISVIVPIYNVEKYLDRCVESIINQTYTNLEIILVDDGSPDNCPDMCDEWARKDCRIKVIHKENGGLSDARNAGMRVATGEYISFIDSDDWVHTEFIESMHSTAITTNAELVACDIEIVGDEFSESHQLVETEYSINTPQEALEALIYDHSYRAVAWNKLYSQSLLSNECFKKGKLHEDEFFTYRIIAKTTTLAYINSKLYYYYKRNGSIMDTVSSKHFDVLYAYTERLNFFKNNYPDLYKKDRINIVKACLNYYIIALSMPVTEQEYCKQVVRECRNSIHFCIKDYFTHGLKDIVIIIMTKLNINLFSKILFKIRNL